MPGKDVRGGVRGVESPTVSTARRVESFRGSDRSGAAFEPVLEFDTDWCQTARNLAGGAQTARGRLAERAFPRTVMLNSPRTANPNRAAVEEDPARSWFFRGRKFGSAPAARPRCERRRLHRLGDAD
jgi:hypothetical protein